MNTSSRVQIDRGENLRRGAGRPAPTNGSPVLVLVGARRLADAHEVRVRVALARHRIRSPSRRAGSACTSRRRRRSPRASRASRPDRRTARGSRRRRRARRARPRAARRALASALRRRHVHGVRAAAPAAPRLRVGVVGASARSARRRAVATASGAPPAARSACAPVRGRGVARGRAPRGAASRSARAWLRRAGLRAEQRERVLDAHRVEHQLRLAQLAPLLEVAPQRSLASTQQRLRRGRGSRRRPRASCSSGSRSGSRRPRASDRDAVRVDAEAGARLRRIVHHDQVERLGVELSPRVRDGVVRLEREADDDAPSRRAARVLARMSAFSASAIARGSPVFLSFSPRARPAESPRARRPSRARRPARSSRSTASRISSVVSTRTSVTPTGSGHARADRRRASRRRRAATRRRRSRRPSSRAVIREEAHRIDRLARRARR